MPADISIAPPIITVARPIQPTRQHRPKVTKAQQEETARKGQYRDALVDAAIEAVRDFVARQADTLASSCGNKQEYYERILFSSYNTSLKGRKANAYNAWSHQVSKEENERKYSLISTAISSSNIVTPSRDSSQIEIDGRNLLDIQRDRREEYLQLTEEEKKDLVASFETERDSRKRGVRINQRGRVQDVRAVAIKMEELVSSDVRGARDITDLAYPQSPRCILSSNAAASRVSFVLFATTPSIPSRRSGSSQTRTLIAISRAPSRSGTSRQLAR